MRRGASTHSNASVIERAQSAHDGTRASKRLPGARLQRLIRHAARNQRAEEDRVAGHAVVKDADCPLARLGFIAAKSTIRISQSQPSAAA